VGYANVNNLGKFFIKRLYALGELSIKEAALAAIKAGETLHASEGEYEDEAMVAQGLSEVVSSLIWPQTEVSKDGIKTVAPELVPMTPLTENQVSALKDWINGDGNDESENETSSFTVADTIRWKFGKGWRKRYKEIIQSRIPDHVEN